MALKEFSDHAGTQTLSLQDNYRSTPQVLVSAETMLAPGLPGDDSAWLKPLRPSGASVEVSYLNPATNQTGSALCWTCCPV